MPTPSEARMAWALSLQLQFRQSPDLRSIRPPPNRNVFAYLVETSSAYHSLKDTEKQREMLGDPSRRLLGVRHLHSFHGD
jgi:hypothetical protein